jgi:hypothetical protein
MEEFIGVVFAIFYFVIIICLFCSIHGKDIKEQAIHCEKNNITMAVCFRMNK